MGTSLMSFPGDIIKEFQQRQVLLFTHRLSAFSGGLEYDPLCPNRLACAMALRYIARLSI